MNRGEMWWVEHPRAGRRPYLVLTRQGAIEAMDNLVGVPATRTIRGIPTEVPLDRADGMPDTCVLALDAIDNVWKGYFVERICRLGLERMDQVCRTLVLSTGC